MIDAVLNSSLATHPGREELLIGINSGFVAQLPAYSNTFYQIQSDLSYMNGVPYLVGYEVPLKTWLANSVHSLRRSFRPEQELFPKALNQVAIESEARINKAKGIPVEDKSKIQPEHFIHEEDLLPIGWLKGALAVSSAVARLTTYRYHQGQPVLFAGSKNPVYDRGTGWLIGKQHVITNHHVINARGPGEPNASDADLNLQAGRTIVQFDFDGGSGEGEMVKSNLWRLG